MREYVGKDLHNDNYIEGFAVMPKEYKNCNESVWIGRGAEHNVEWIQVDPSTIKEIEK